ncbi:large neutral amino acids transporter small subunit 1-like [Glandiceps talaboti]
MAEMRTRKSQLQSTNDEPNNAVCKTQEEKKKDNKDTHDDAVVLKRQLNLFFCITIIVGTTIGSGIFISPKGVLLNAQSVGVSLIVWGSCGIFVILGGLIYAELGTTFGKAGGDYAYIYEGFGPVPAFLVVWITLVVATPASFSILAITFATYLTKPFFFDCETPQIAVTLVAVACLTAVFFVNIWKVKAAARTQNIFTVAKVIGLLMIIVGGIAQLFQGKTENLENAFEGGTGSILDFSLAYYSALFAYGGWNNMNMLTEEIQNPNRNFPIAVVVAEVTITLIYVSTNIAYLTVMSADELLASDAVALLHIIIPVIFFTWVLYLEVTGLIAAPVEAGIGLGIILTGVPVYYFGQWKNKPKSFKILTGKAARFLQQYLLVVKQEKETF